MVGSRQKPQKKVRAPVARSSKDAPDREPGKAEREVAADPRRRTELSGDSLLVKRACTSSLYGVSDHGMYRLHPVLRLLVLRGRVERQNRTAARPRGF